MNASHIAECKGKCGKVYDAWDVSKERPKGDALRLNDKILEWVCEECQGKGVKIKGVNVKERV